MFILAATRTPFCKVGGELSSLTAADLGRAVTSSLLLQTGIDPAEISETIFGCTHPPIDSVNIARLIALRSGIPHHIPASTLQRDCASGLEVLTAAHQRITASQGDLFLIGATESMSNIPLLFPPEAALHFADLNRAKSSSQKLTAAASFNLSDFRPKIGLEMALLNSFTGETPTQHSEELASQHSITEKEQNNYAQESRRKAHTAQASLAAEITPLFIDGTPIQQDHQPLSKNNALDKSPNNADGAVALLVGTQAAAHRLGIQPLGKLISYAYSGCHPSSPEQGPITAIEKIKQLTGLTPDDAHHIEIHEPSAAQTIATISALRKQGYKIPQEQLNPHGGTIAHGHPTAATSARMILTALRQLHQNPSPTFHRALITTSISGGQGAAIYLEKV